MILGCPGSQGFKQPHPETIDCPVCGYEIEIWSDEAQVECPKCRKAVAREGGQCCLDWCKYARQCAGPGVYDEYIKRKAQKK